MLLPLTAYSNNVTRFEATFTFVHSRYRVTQWHTAVNHATTPEFMIAPNVDLFIVSFP